MRGWSYNVLYVYRRTTNDNDDDDDDDDKDIRISDPHCKPVSDENHSVCRKSHLSSKIFT